MCAMPDLGLNGHSTSGLMMGVVLPDVDPQLVAFSRRFRCFEMEGHLTEFAGAFWHPDQRPF
jgi:hypothetical protein